MQSDIESALAAYTGCYTKFRGTKWEPRALVRVGVCQAGLGDVKSARTTFEKYLRDFPKEKPSDRRKVQTKYLTYLSLFGLPAPPIRS